MERTFRFLAGALIGAIFGCIIAILITPSSGSELRSRITSNAARLKDEVRQAAVDKRSELEKELGDLRHHIVIN